VFLLISKAARASLPARTPPVNKSTGEASVRKEQSRQTAFVKNQVGRMLKASRLGLFS
jgi:hypothetical protein